MNRVHLPLPQALPLRLGSLLWDGHFQPTLDALDQALYRSPMNNADGLGNPIATAPEAGTAEAGTGTVLFAFLQAADRLYGRLAEALGRVGLSYAKYEILKRLRESQEPVSLGSLAAAQSCARSNITQLVDRLEAEGLVRRVDDPADRRGVRAELTPAGFSQVEEGATQIDLVRAQFAAMFTAPERAELLRLLSRVR